MSEQLHDSLEDLFRHYAKPLYFYLLKMTGSETTAEDLVQETFYRATVSLTVTKMADMRAWLFKVARNAYIDEWRKRSRWKWLPFREEVFRESYISPYGQPLETLLASEMAGDITDLMSYLPENYRTILYLREFEQFSYVELGQALGLTESQVKVTLHRARKRLQQLAEKQGWRRDEYDKMDDE